MRCASDRWKSKSSACYVSSNPPISSMRLRRTRAVIAEDEAEHAELAWVTVAWALRIGGEPVRRVVADEIAALKKAQRSAESSAEEPLARFGVLSDRRFGELRADAIEQLILPLLSQLLQGDGAVRRRSSSPSVSASA